MNQTILRKWLAVLLAVVMCLGLLPAGAMAEEGTPKPTNSKELKDNGDGTYTITLSVTGQGETTTTTSGANVVVVLDVSGSMNTATGKETYTYTEWNGGPGQGTKYGIIDGVDGYVELTRFWENYYWNDPENGWSRYSDTIYVRSTQNETRLDAAKTAIGTLAETLFAQNEENPETIQMALVVFADTGAVVQIDGKDVTTDKDAFKAAVNDRYANGGTNWEDGLKQAQAVNFGDNDPTYVIFISDGNPTFRITQGTPNPGYTNGRYGNNNWQTYTADEDRNFDTSNFNTDGIYGNGTDDIDRYHDLASNNVARCYNEAIDDAKNIVDGGGTLYTIGAYGNVNRMAGLTDYAYGGVGQGSDYYNSVTDTEALNSTLSDIADEITNSLALTNVSFSDGITGMTEVAVGGDGENVTGFTYKKKDEVWTDAPKASFQEGKVVWNLGNTKLASGETASVSFVVYPSQDSLDLIADLNNGVKTWDSLTDDEKSQIKVGSDGSYSLKTNTKAELTYSTVTTTTNAQGESTEVVSDPATIDMTMAGQDSISLESTKLKLKKVWKASLDVQQYNDLLYNKDGTPTKYQISLNVKKGEETYLANQVLGWDDTANDYVWEKDFAIAPGIMVSAEHAADSGLSTEGKDTVTYNEKTYYLLEPGHDYTLEENTGGDYHFELEDKVYHPMFIDGTLYNVTLSSDDESMSVDTAEAMTAVTATNNLKGGIMITKNVVVAEGSQAPANPKNDAFQIKVDMKNADGTAYSVDADVGGWRVIYGPNNPKANPTTGSDGVTTYGRSDRTGITDGTFTATVYDGDSILVGNVDSGVTYKVQEITNNLPNNYAFTSIEGKDGDVVVDVDEDGVASGTVKANTSSAITVTNTYTASTGDLTITKTTSGDTTTPETAKFTVTGPEGFGTNRLQEITYDKFTNGSYTFEDIPLGTYTVAESGADVAGYTLTTTYDLATPAPASDESGEAAEPETPAADDGSETTEPATSATVEVAADGPNTVKITNTYTSDTGILTITKEATGTTVPDAASFSITGAPTSGAEFETKTVSYANFENGIYSLTVPAGTYSVTESGAEVGGYTLTADTSLATNIKVEKDSTGTATIKNTYTRDTGTLVVEKLFNGITKDLVPAVELTIKDADKSTYQTVKVDTSTIAELEDGILKFVKEFTNVPTGSYTVTESESTAQVSGYKLDPDTTKTTATATVTKGESATATITNKYIPTDSGLEVDKVAQKPEGQSDESYKKYGAVYKEGDTITYTITVTNTGNTTLTDIKVGDNLEGVVIQESDNYTINPDDGTVNIASLASKNNVQITATYTVGDDAMVVKNTATATGEDPSGNDVTDTDTETVYKDAIGGGDDPDKPDGTPDIYQVRVNYIARTGGTVGDPASEVLTLPDGAEKGTVTTVKGNTATASSGYRFVNWTNDFDANTISTAATGNITFTDIAGGKVVNVYANFNRSGGGGGGPRPRPTPIPDEDVPLAPIPDALNGVDHFAYVKGYPDGTVKPEGNVTRAETSTMLYRLLKPTWRDIYFTDQNSFSDVEKALWFNKAVSSMANGEYVNGYPDGTFQGNKSITRAEFVTIMIRFLGEDPIEENPFTDIGNHWAKDYILTAVGAGWIDGYPDGTFQPNALITRAEAMKIINSVLHRGVNETSELGNFINFPDNEAGKWYYYEVLEAVNDHEHEGERPNENWTSNSVDYFYDIVKYEHPGA